MNIKDSVFEQLSNMTNQERLVYFVNHVTLDDIVSCINYEKDMVQDERVSYLYLSVSMGGEVQSQLYSFYHVASLEEHLRMFLLSNHCKELLDFIDLDKEGDVGRFVFENPMYGEQHIVACYLV